MSTQPVHAELAAKIQSTLISNALTTAQWDAHIQSCLRYHFGAAMIPAAWVKRTADALHGSGIKVASFIDLPFGTMTSAGKAYEAARVVENGAQEIDLMPNIGFLLSGMKNEFFEDVRGVVEAVPGTPIKIMLELPLLSPTERERAVALSVEAGVAYLKNASSGAVGTATPEDIRFLRHLAPRKVGIKASGGIKNIMQVRELLEAGADLVGTSAGPQIMAELDGSDIVPERGQPY